MISGTATLAYAPQSAAAEGYVQTGPGVTSTDIYTVIRILMPVAFVTEVSNARIAVTPSVIANSRYVGP